MLQLARVGHVVAGLVLGQDLHQWAELEPPLLGWDPVTVAKERNMFGHKLGSAWFVVVVQIKSEKSNLNHCTTFSLKNVSSGTTAAGAVGVLFSHMLPRDKRIVYRRLITYTKSVSSRSCATGWKTRARRRIPSRQAVSSELANTLPAAQHRRQVPLQTHVRVVVKAKKAGE